MAGDFKRKFWEPLRSAVARIREFAYAPPLSTRHQVKLLARPRLGLALSGGFAHGVAHLGVLKSLAENHIPVDALAGTSVGSVVGAAFASGCGLEEMIEEARKIRWKTFGRWTFGRLGLATNERMEAMLHRVLRCLKFEDLPIPLVVVAADISTGEAVVFRHGELIPPLRASCSFPGLFTPVSYQGRLLVDGAIVANVPVGPLRDLGADVVVGVNLRTNGRRHAPTNIFQVIGQAFQIAQGPDQGTWRKHCDVVIEPEVSHIRWDDFSRADDLIQAGEQAAGRIMPALRAIAQAPHIAVAESARGK